MDSLPKISAEMKQRYIDRRKSDLEVLMDALSEHNFEAFERIGHQLKGNAQTFGFEDLAMLAQELEAAGLKADAPSARKLVLKLSAWIQAQPKESL